LDCPETEWLSNDAYFKLFSRKLDERRVPVSGSIALTSRCNLRCQHCYLGSQQKKPSHISRELGTEKWMAIMDEFTEAGCLYLLLTGGEPLLRDDFSTLYTHAKTSGLITSVFTNGTRLTPDIIELFCDLPPAGLEISLYGASEETYRKITGIPGAYNKCLQGMERLQAAGIVFSLKTILMTANLHEFHAIKTLAQHYDVGFRFDAAIFPCLDGNQKPLALRVAPEQAVRLELEDPEMIARWHAFLDRQGDLINTDRLYNCGTGLTSFYVDSVGNLQPCVLANEIQYNLLEGPFKKGWVEVIPQIREIRVDKTMECAQCEKRLMCGLCPAFFKLENGSAEIKSDYLCALGHQRYNTIFGLN
jgi:radical SAM protein with 4Fe4S-binding SPASM domain